MKFDRKIRSIPASKMRMSFTRTYFFMGAINTAAWIIAAVIYNLWLLLAGAGCLALIILLGIRAKNKYEARRKRSYRERKAEKRGGPVWRGDDPV